MGTVRSRWLRSNVYTATKHRLHLRTQPRISCYLETKGGTDEERAMKTDGIQFHKKILPIGAIRRASVRILRKVRRGALFVGSATNHLGKQLQ